jgi:hypothetical protein
MAAMITTIPCTSINTCPPPLPTIPMQSPHGSDASSGESENHSGPIMHPPTTGFKITPQDTNILDGYIDEFEKADTQTRNNILEKVMGELYRLRPDNSVFDKKEAKQACIQSIHICICVLIPMLENQEVVLQSLLRSSASGDQIHSEMVRKECLLP